MWGDVHGDVQLVHSVEPPFASNTSADRKREIIHVPTREFMAVCRAWSRGQENVKRGPLHVYEVHVFEKTGLPVPTMNTSFSTRTPSTYRVRFEIGKRWFLMWGVTWRYVVQNAVGRRT